MKIDVSEKRIGFAEFAEICREHGIKATQQRFEIYSMLVGSPDHPDAESVYSAIRKILPSISFDTVYRTIRMLEEKGVISRVVPGLERMRYDANRERHHHFICVKCGMIKDFYSEDFNSIAPPDSINDIGQAEYVHIEVRGVCHKCKEKQ